MNRVILVMSMLSFGCSSSTSGPEGACASNTDCESGQICESGQCNTLCTSDSNCPPGQICTASVCTDGTRADVPVITGVNGDGTAICNDTPLANCVVTGLIVDGEKFEGAAFEMVDSLGAVSALSVRPGATDVRVQLDLPDLAPDNYVLRAVNAAGQADQAVTLLQGVPGPTGPVGPAGPTGPPGNDQDIHDAVAAIAGPGSGLDADSVDGSGLADIQALINAAMDEATPVGTVAAFAGDAAPAGWLLCDGAEVSRVMYAELFAAVGVLHGGGDGSTTFHLPDYRGRFLRGVDNGSGRDVDAGTRTAPAVLGNAGDNVGSIQDSAYLAHTHRVSAGGSMNWNDFLAGSTNTYGVYTPFNSGGTLYNPNEITGSGESRPKNAYVNFLIKH